MWVSSQMSSSLKMKIVKFISWTVTSFTLFFFFFKFYLFIYFWLHWVFTAARELSLVAPSRGYSSLWCAGFMGFSLWWLLLLRGMGSRRTGFSSCGMRASVVVAHGL